MPTPSEVTQLLENWAHGEEGALDHLVQLLYDDLHRIAERLFHRERQDHTLRPTALVNELYLKMRDQHSIPDDNRAAFFVFATEQIRRILVDHARRRQADRRGGGETPLPFDELLAPGGPTRDDQLVALDGALDRLKEEQPRTYEIVQLHLFGFTQEEIAERLEISRSTILREWKYAKRWLARELRC